MSKNKSIFAIIIIVIFLITIFYSKNNKEKKLELIFFDVGQGDSALIKTPYNQDILIDGGPDNSVLEKLGKHMGFLNNDIELMILSHPHEDHLTGLLEVVKRYKVERLLYTGVVYESNVYKIFLDEIRREGSELILVDEEQKIDLGEKLSLNILYPQSNLSGLKHKNINNTSIVSQLVYGEKTFVFMGDAEGEEEDKLKKEDLGNVAVLKISHHGSGTNNEDFLRFLSPEFTIISVGKDNKFGHPNENILGVLKKINSVVLRTDISGDISFLSDGFSLALRQ